MRIAVTGGAGFIGSHAVDALVRRGDAVLVIDDLSSGKREQVSRGAELVVADVTQEAAGEALERFCPEAVLHLAAQMDVRVSVAEPRRDATTNVVGTVAMLAAAARAGAKTFVLASTGGAIYGEQERFPADEAHPTRATSPYGVAKRCAELYVEHFARERGLRGVALRFANVYGPRQDPHGEAGVVAIFLSKMLRGEAPVIYGDGRQTRDYVFVEDAVNASLLALSSTAATGAYNVGTGIETDVATLAQRLAELVGYRGPLSSAAARPGEQQRSVLDSGRARRELGWAPTVGLADGLARTVEYFSRL